MTCRRWDAAPAAGRVAAQAGGACTTAPSHGSRNPAWCSRVVPGSVRAGRCGRTVPGKPPSTASRPRAPPTLARPAPPLGSASPPWPCPRPSIPQEQQMCRGEDSGVARAALGSLRPPGRAAQHAAQADGLPTWPGACREAWGSPTGDLALHCVRVDAHGCALGWDCNIATRAQRAARRAASYILRHTKQAERMLARPPAHSLICAEWKFFVAVSGGEPGPSESARGFSVFPPCSRNCPSANLIVGKTGKRCERPTARDASAWGGGGRALC